MRKRITSLNYGKYYETVFVCSSKAFDTCHQLANTLQIKYGVKSHTINGDQFEHFDKEIKNVFKKAYCVIFVLTTEVIDIINKSFDTDDINLKNKHPFIKTYAYVNKINPHAIACVIEEGYNIKDNLKIPEYMGDFSVLHRLELKLKDYCTNYDAHTIFDNVRYFYSPKKKTRLNFLHDKGSEIINDYYFSIRYYNNRCLVITIIISLLTLLLAPAYRFDPEYLWLYYLLLPLPMIYVAFKEMFIRKNIYRLYSKKNILPMVIEVLLFTIKSILFLLTGILTSTGDISGDLVCVYFLLYQLWQICKFALLSIETKVLNKHLKGYVYLYFAGKRIKFKYIATLVQLLILIIIVFGVFITLP